jgi:hypothetical protein
MGFKPLKEGQKWDEFYQYIIYPSFRPQIQENKENEKDQENVIPIPLTYEALQPKFVKDEKEVSIKISAANFKPSSEKIETNMKETVQN